MFDCPIGETEKVDLAVHSLIGLSTSDPCFWEILCWYPTPTLYVNMALKRGWCHTVSPSVHFACPLANFPSSPVPLDRRSSKNHLEEHFHFPLSLPFTSSALRNH